MTNCIGKYIHYESILYLLVCENRLLSNIYHFQLLDFLSFSFFLKKGNQTFHFIIQFEGEKKQFQRSKWIESLKKCLCNKIEECWGRRAKREENHFFLWKHVTTLIKRMKNITRKRQRDKRRKRQGRDRESEWMRDQASERWWVKQDWKSLQ